MVPHQTPTGLRAALYREIINVIDSGLPMSDEHFNSTALRIFSYQLSANQVYRGYFEAARLSAPTHWKQIPALPAAAFKRADVRSFPVEAIRTWFQTSGTTEGETGFHYFETLELYEKAIIPPFKHFLLPDAERMRMEFLTDTKTQMPHSSLVHMMETIRIKFGTPESGYHVNGATVNLDSLTASLEHAAQKQQPVFLLGTAFGFVHALEEMSRRKMKFNLPFGSRIMETGGFKGRVHEVSRPEFYPVLSDAFGIPAFNIVNEYGMTELSSQFYDRSLRDQTGTEWKVGPAWCRVLCVDPETGREQPYGEPGLIRVIDLANVGSVIALQTEDVGVAAEDGSFKVLGRIQQSAPRGCSMMLEAQVR